ncbi:uncharacterized protein LOC114522160 [Dendronephthya gigantea]|uniref:uncharacterized protein LOC114522160 n=1 Tax=Dendronephthya gigantea TaxID=151771 RepID=UPI00106C7F51|nr:uncharacterized protein LOC114522160 [Dendronephthya gigantea]
MYRLHLRLVQRVIIITTSISLFGSISVWLSMFTGLELQPYGERHLSQVTHDLSAKVSSENGLNDGAGSRSFKQDVVAGMRNKTMTYSSSIIKRVFGIHPFRISNRHRADTDGKQEIISIAMDQREGEEDKYIFVFHHYEQFGKTTENFVQLCSIAVYGSRVVVEPFVRDSRMCGLKTGWWGKELTPSRLFKPLGLYFDVKAMNEILSQNQYTTVRPLTQFKRVCNKTTSNITLVHFLYNDGKETTKMWFQLSEKDYQNIYLQTNNTGWYECPFIDRGLNISKRLGDTTAGRQLCVNAERITDHKMFENDILQGDKCVVITYWKGFGKNRTHFKPQVKLNAREIVHRLHHSNLILQEAELYRRTFLERTYIALHVRSERQLLWYSEQSLLKCVHAVLRRVFKLKKEHGIQTVFLATDLTRYGSDTLVSNKPNSLKRFEKLLMNFLKPKRYSPHQTDPLLMDHGVVAIVEMNILSQAKHLVTLGSGSFQEWVMALFIERKKGEEQDWTITRVCSKEKKAH